MAPDERARQYADSFSQGAGNGGLTKIVEYLLKFQLFEPYIHEDSKNTCGGQSFSRQRGDA
jgi:hypothetical protein